MRSFILVLVAAAVLIDASQAVADMRAWLSGQRTSGFLGAVVGRGSWGFPTRARAQARSSVAFSGD